jgi:hypothetical protein
MQLKQHTDQSAVFSHFLITLPPSDLLCDHLLHKLKVLYIIVDAALSRKSWFT